MIAQSVSHDRKDGCECQAGKEMPLSDRIDDQVSTSEQDGGPSETSYVDRKQAAKDRAKKMRRESYERGQAIMKAKKAERAKSPEGQAERERMRLQRREAYLRAKEAYRGKDKKPKRQGEEQARLQAEAAEAERQEELLAAVKNGDKLRPHLRLVKPGETF